MQASGLPLLASWQNFYIIIGAAAATLTGLMFVVITLMAGIETRVETANAGLAAFNTPTVLHFCTVLLLAGILSAPWLSYSSPALLLALAGLGGVLYLLVVFQRMRRVPDYQTPAHDWVWYLSVPLSAYFALFVAAGLLPTSPEPALYLIGAAMVALLFLGIRNAWDLVTYLAIDRVHRQ